MSAEDSDLRGRASLLAVTALGAELAAEHTTLTETLDLLATSTGDLLRADVTVWWAVDGPTRAPRGMAGTGPPDELVDRVADDEVLRMLRHGVPVMLRDHGSARRIIVGIEVADRTVGAIDVAAREGGVPLDATDLAAVVALSARVGSALTAKRLRDDLQHRADHDDLTGLPNRASLTQHLDTVLTGDDADGCAVVFIDVDRFKLINDSLGHATGDEVLRAVANRLRHLVRAEDVVARFGGDEFVVVATGFDDETDVEWLLDRVTATSAEPIRVGGQRVFVTLSAGLARRHDGDDADSMLRHADAAMYGAKLSPTHRWLEYSQALQSAAAHRLGLESDLHEALRAEQFHCEYQPVVDLPSLRPVAHEALARWQHPLLGRVPPDTFIPVVESCGLMPAFTDLVLDRSLRAAMTWPAGIAVTVNLSARHLGDRRLAPGVLEALVGHGAPAERLVVEITETAVMEDPVTAAANLEELHAAGVRIAVDDFGTGYTSIDDLRRLPVDLVKIDLSFVAEAGTSQGGRMLSALLALATALDAEAIAEGVETVGQLDVLRELGFRLAQGFLLGRPVTDDLVAHDRLVLAGVAADRSAQAWSDAVLLPLPRG